MKFFEAKPGFLETAKLNEPIDSDDSSDISSSDDSLLGTNHNTNFETASTSSTDDDDFSSGGEDGIVLHLHDIRYMREAVKHPDYRENYEEYYDKENLIFDEVPITPRIPVIRFQVPLARGRRSESLRRNRSYETADSQTSYVQVLRHDSQVNLLENHSTSGSNASLNDRAVAAEEANNNDNSRPGPSTTH